MALTYVEFNDFEKKFQKNMIRCKSEDEYIGGLPDDDSTNRTKISRLCKENGSI